jgi:hypothetical protein
VRSPCTGDGRLAVALAVLLAKAGVGRVVVASGRSPKRTFGFGYTDADIGLPRRKAAAEAIRRANPSTRTSRLLGDRRPELVLTDAVVPAPEVVGPLVHNGIPHLAVRVRDVIGIVGPLALPGRSSGLTCADLHPTALDSRWPMTAGQLAGRPQRADLGDVQACAALAAAQALRVLSPEETPPGLERHPRDRFLLRRRTAALVAGSSPVRLRSALIRWNTQPHYAPGLLCRTRSARHNRWRDRLSRPD